MGDVMRVVEELVGGGMAVFAGVIYFVLLVFLVVYVMGHVKRKEGQKEDPFLGAKVMLTLFMSICFQSLLVSLAAILTIATLKVIPRGAFDLPIGLFLGSVVAGIFPTVMFFAGIRGRGAVSIGRKALGINAIIAGLFSTLGLIALFVMALMDQNVLKVAMVTFVYLFAFIGCTMPIVRSASMSYIQEEGE